MMLEKEDEPMESAALTFFQRIIYRYNLEIIFFFTFFFDYKKNLSRVKK